MLFTRCPSCQTTFRISADTLRVANGAVRCGSCATVFSAYSGLRQDALDEGMRNDDEVLSPTLQTKELASIEEISSPDLSDADEVIGLESPAEDLASDADTDAAAEPADTLPPEPPEKLRLDPAAASPAESPAEPGSAQALEPEATAEPALTPQTADAVQEEPESLHFEAPVDEWAQLLSEIERSVPGNAPATEEVVAERDEATPTEQAEAVPEDLDATSEPEDPKFWVLGEQISLTSQDSGERETLLSVAEHDQIPGSAELGLPEASTAHARQAQEPSIEPADELDDELDTETIISAEEIDATLSAEPDLVAELEAEFGQLRPADRASRPWIIGAAALALLLALQVVHHNRTALASRPLIGGVMQTTYGLLGLEILPAWDLQQYEITNWAATAGPDDTGADNLHITAQIRNRGPKAQPYPSLQLELKDRWEAVIGSRVFLPSEYLASDSDAAELMTAGAAVPANLAVVDPGVDASGFELDVCLETEGGRVRCAADRVFE